MRKYLAVWMMVPTWLKRPIIDSRVPLEHCLCISDKLMSCCQSSLLLVVRWTLKDLVLICQPKTILTSDGKPSARCLILLMMSVLFVASWEDGGLKRHSKAMGTACVSLSGMSPIATPAMKISSMKLSATIFLGGSLTMRGSALPKEIEEGSIVGFGSRKGKLD